MQKRSQNFEKAHCTDARKPKRKYIEKGRIICSLRSMQVSFMELKSQAYGRGISIRAEQSS